MEEPEVYEIVERPDFEKNISRLVKKKRFLSLPKQIIVEIDFMIERN